MSQVQRRFVYASYWSLSSSLRDTCKPWSDQISTRSQQLHSRTSVSFVRPSCPGGRGKKKSLREQKDQFIRNQSESLINFAHLTDNCDLRGQLHLNQFNYKENDLKLRWESNKRVFILVFRNNVHFLMDFRAFSWFWHLYFFQEKQKEICFTDFIKSRSEGYRKMLGNHLLTPSCLNLLPII